MTTARALLKIKRYGSEDRPAPPSSRARALVPLLRVRVVPPVLVDPVLGDEGGEPLLDAREHVGPTPEVVGVHEHVRVEDEAVVVHDGRRAVRVDRAVRARAR